MLWDTKRIYIDQTDTEPSSECSGLANKTWQESQGGKIILVDQYDFLSKKLLSVDSSGESKRKEKAGQISSYICLSSENEKVFL